jgi:hypothetical protein
VVREGTALLQGLVLCGQCGRRMSVRYVHDGRRPLYECNQLHSQLGAPTCQFIRGDGIDAAVAEAFLEALTPAQIAIALEALERLEARAQGIERHWQLRLERARYEADLARRRCLAVEPEHRLVAPFATSGPWSGSGTSSSLPWSAWSASTPRALSWPPARSVPRSANASWRSPRISPHCGRPRPPRRPSASNCCAV